MDLLADLNEPQRRAVMHVDGPLLVLAGAGSGKTRVITRRVARLIDQGAPAGAVLAITFTNKAAQEMRERVAAATPARGVTVCTFHALCARLLREFAGEVALDGNYSIYDRDDQLRAVKDAMKRAEMSADRLAPTAVLSTISNAKNDLLTPEAYANQAADFYQRNVSAIYTAYQDALSGNNAMDFDDLLLKTAMLLRDRPDIRRRLGERYRYILIDEYQDTNRAQYIIAHGIAMDHDNICATGDPDQSIYAWRGANIRNILEFEQDYPSAVVVHLEENYRSTTPILTTASKLIAHNTQRKDKRLWTSRPVGASVRLCYYDDERAEAAGVVRRILECVGSGGSHDDVAIFYRLNSLSRVLEEALMREGVPYRIARGVEFYNRKEIRDVLAYLRLLVNPADDLSCQRIINVPARKIGATTVGRLSDYARANGLSLLAACRDGAAAGLSAAAAKKVADFARMIDELTEDIDLPVRDIVEQVVLRTGLEDMHRHSDDPDSQAWANIAELVSTAAEFDQRMADLAQAPQADAAAEGVATEMETGLAGYLQEVSLVSDTDHLTGSGAVTLMTLHAAKGLEFPSVYIVGCEAGLLPFEWPGDSGQAWAARADDRLEEERRLTFVGMTRAQDELTMSCVKERMLRGRRQPQSASQFLREIGTEHVEVADHTTTTVPRRRKTAGRGGFVRAGGAFYDDAAERAIIEAMAEQVTYEAADDDVEPPPPEYEHLTVGCTVQHGRFGIGKVAKLSQPWPDTRVVVDFHEVGRKTLVLKMAKLDLL